MEDEGLTPRVRQFITDHLDSVMQLETLLLLAGQPGKVWTAADLAQQLRLAVEWVDSQLRAMTAAGLLTNEETSSPTRFRYEPKTAELAGTVEELGRAYAARRVTVIGLIFSKPMDKIRSFADAFKFRKDKSDG